MSVDKRVAREAFLELVKRYKSYPEYLGIEITEPNQPGFVDDTLLHLVSRLNRLEDIKILLAAGADVNVAGDMDNRPLHGAAMKDNVEAINMLLAAGANPKSVNEFGEIPYDVAYSLGNTRAMQILGRYN